MSFNLLLQYLLPQHILSRLVAKIANCRSFFIKKFIIKQYSKFYHIDMTEALEPNLDNYPTFNDFFTRALKPDARPIAADNQTIISPVDGKIWQIGAVNTKMITAKGKSFTLDQLFADTKDATAFSNANFAVLYLAPSNYHRIHMPLAGKLEAMRHIPGKLFSVSPAVTDQIPDVFARNERVISLFNTPYGKMAVIFVGAIIVGSIETKWSGVVTPSNQKDITNWHYLEQNLTFAHGEEIGKFKLGSTVILLFPEGTMQWEKNLTPETPIKMGQKLGIIL